MTPSAITTPTSPRSVSDEVTEIVSVDKRESLRAANEDIFEGEDAPKKKVPVQIFAAWDKGVIQCPDLSLTSHFPFERNFDTELSSLSSYGIASHAPLILAAASICQSFHAEAIKQRIEIKFIQVTATGEANFTAFYCKFHDWNAKTPWKSINLAVKVDSDHVSQEELERIARQVEEQQTPTKELLKEHFCIEVKLDIETAEEGKQQNGQKEGQKMEQYYDLEKYKAIGTEAGTAGPVVHQQLVTCTYEDNSAIMHVDVDGIRFPLSATETVEVGSTVDGQATHVQAFFFGCLAFYMHSFAIRLALKRHVLYSLEGTFKTTMNNGVKDYDDGLGPLVFSLLGGEIHLKVKSDATKIPIGNAFLETQDMAPTYLATSGKIDINIDVVKV